MDCEATGHEQSPMGCNFGAWLRPRQLQRTCQLTSPGRSAYSHRKTAGVPHSRSLIIAVWKSQQLPSLRTRISAKYLYIIYIIYIYILYTYIIYIYIYIHYSRLYMYIPVSTRSFVLAEPVCATHPSASGQQPSHFADVAACKGNIS